MLSNAASPNCSPKSRELLTLLERRRHLRTAKASQDVAFAAFLARPDFCDLAPSPLIAAIAAASEGQRPDTIDDAAAERHFGCPLAALPTTRPRTVVVRAGGRGGKTSRLLAPKALHAAWTVPAPLLGKGEEAYAIIVAPSLKLARQALSFCKGYVDGSPVLTAAKTSESTEHIALTRPWDGAKVRIEVFAAGRGGAQLRGKSLLFVGLDEACFLRDEATGVINDAELYRAVLQRVVPGGQVWLVSTPWLAGVGILEDFVTKDWGTHLHALVATAPTRALNPNWDPTGEVERDLRAQDPDAAEREIDAVPQAGGSSLFFSPEAITHAVDDRRPVQLPREPGRDYGAGGDCAFKRNSSALCVVAHDGERYDVALVEELKPTVGTPLKPSAVVEHFAGLLRGYGVTELAADSHEFAEVSQELARHKISAVPAPDKVESYIHARSLLHEGRLGLPPHPRFLRQLRDVVSKPQPGGGLSISSPRKADGSHGDLVSAWVLAVWRATRSTPQRVTRVRSER
jgi:hypothetical protein